MAFVILILPIVNSLTLTGFSLAIDDQLVYGNIAAELFLLKTIPASVGLSSAVIKHILSRILAFKSDIETRHKFAAVTYRNESRLSADCNTVIKGPDTVPIYSPSTDNGGCFIEDEGQNNCYDYGTDVLTNTFAQPGRGSGAKWTSNTCEDITASAERDGLKWAGKTLPTAAPETGHYVALLIWPDTNFHWVRLDAGGKWSHKPGGSPVRNVDDDGKEIVDPSLSNFSPWTNFCGYFVVVPSEIQIN
jgi:hypothetical protein